MTRTHLAAALAALLLLPTAAQAAELEPISCWWRMNVPAIRVGQPFDLTLTCGVVETADAKVVPDESKLEPGAAQFPPFEVLGGHRGPDQHDNVRRFFQYTYTLRLVTDDAFGRDVPVTLAPISYRIDTKAAQDDVQGRTKTYRLPTVPVRVVSLVAADANGPRESVTESFAAIEDRAFRAKTLKTAAGVLNISALVLLVGMALQTWRRTRRVTRAPRQEPVAPRLALLAVLRELNAVGGQASGGWSDELCSRAAAAALGTAAPVAHGAVGLVQRAGAGGRRSRPAAARAGRTPSDPRAGDPRPDQCPVRAWRDGRRCAGPGRG